jgi:serine/threonine protein kinase
MTRTVRDAYGLILRSGLLAEHDAAELRARWQGEAAGRSADPQRFVGWLVVNKHLTEYQGALLLRGFADGFFLNEYKVLDRLGRGKMAGVYKAQHRLGQVFALKVLPPSKAREPNLKNRFLREARLALQLKHPNVVRSFQMGEARGLHYLVMEYLEGETLAALFARRGRLPPDEAVHLTHQALQGLGHVHARGMVHRDLKPSNVMVVYPGGVPCDDTTNATVKILDIGLGRPLLEEGPPGADTALTSERFVIGTPDYMAPEQARDARAADVRSDIYSLGCVLYHALAGRPPFPDGIALDVMIRHATEAPQPLKELNPAVPDGLQQIVDRMMAKNPDDRYPTPERAADALRMFLAATDAEPATPENDPRMRAYLDWLEAQVIHADLPAWLAEMDTLTAADLRKAREEAFGPRPFPLADEPASGNTMIVRKLPPAAPGRERLSPADASVALVPDSAPEADAAPGGAGVGAGAEPAHVVAEDDRPPSTRQGRFSRREWFVFAAGAVAGAVVATVGSVMAFQGHRASAGSAGGSDNRATAAP